MEPECLISLLHVSVMELAPNPTGSSPHSCVSKNMSFEIHFNVVLFCISYIPHEYVIALIFAPKILCCSIWLLEWKAAVEDQILESCVRISHVPIVCCMFNPCHSSWFV